MAQEQLMTVGELAQRVGVSVRTVQYYDQKGLLHPSQTGPANQRLYTEDDENELHHILVLKYLGLSLSSIASVLEETQSKQRLQQVVLSSRAKLDDELLAFFERLAVLRELSKTLAEGEGDQVDWNQLTSVIEQSQKDKDTFWQKLAAEGVIEFAGLTREDILGWHALMGETIEAMQNGESVSSERGRSLGQRFRDMGGMDVAMAGLARMGSHDAAGMQGAEKPTNAASLSPSEGASQNARYGRDFYHLLQDRTLGYLQQAADLL